MSAIRRLAVALPLTAGFGLVTAHAALLPVSSARVGAGEGIVAACDTDGVSVAYTNVFDTTIADYRTTGVTVSGLAAACTGRVLSVTIRSSVDASLWQGSATVAASSVAMSVPSVPLVRSAAIAGWAVTVTG